MNSTEDAEARCARWKEAATAMWDRDEALLAKKVRELEADCAAKDAALEVLASKLGGDADGAYDMKNIGLASYLGDLENIARKALSPNTGAGLLAVVTAARDFADNGTTLTMCDRGPCQRVIEAKDRSDPQMKLFNALSALDATRNAQVGEMGDG